MLQFQFDPLIHRFELSMGETVFRFSALDGLALRDWHREYADVYVHWIDGGRAVIARARRSGNTIESMVRSVKGMLAVSQVTTDRLVDALASYDITGELSRSWIEEHLSDEQLILILRMIVAAHR